MAFLKPENDDSGLQLQENKPGFIVVGMIHIRLCAY